MGTIKKNIVRYNDNYIFIFYLKRSISQNERFIFIQIEDEILDPQTIDNKDSFQYNRLVKNNTRTVDQNF